MSSRRAGGWSLIGPARAVLLWALGLAVAACAPISVSRIDTQTAHRQLSRSALSSG